MFSSCLTETTKQWQTCPLLKPTWQLQPEKSDTCKRQVCFLRASKSLQHILQQLG